jgi:hypothetical protein
VIAKQHAQFGPIFGPQSIAELFGGRVRVHELTVAKHEHGDRQRVDDGIETDSGTGGRHQGILRCGSGF